MDHNDKVKAEFTRQGEAFRDSPVLGATDITARIAAALEGGHDRVLDIACGPGVLLPALSACTKTLVGFDLTPKCLQLAREAQVAGSLHLVRGLSEHLPFRPSAFDATVLRLALHHFLQPGAALASARSTTRSGGRLIVLDLLAPEDAEARALRDAIERFRDPSHTSLLSRSEMGREIEQAGFMAPKETLWSQRKEFREWARIIQEPQRMNDLEQVLRALATAPGNPAGLDLSCDDEELWFTYDWGLYVAEVG